MMEDKALFLSNKIKNWAGGLREYRQKVPSYLA
jgi:hypothetical protein